ARCCDSGNRTVDNWNRAERFTGGGKGDTLFNGTWGYEGAFIYCQVEQSDKGKVSDGGRVNRILNANDQLFDPGSSEFIGQTVPYNPFVDGQHVAFPSNQPLLLFATQFSKRSEEHTSELQSRFDLVCRLLLEKKK